MTHSAGKLNEVVLTLLARSRYGQGEGYSVYVDRLYSSPNLFNFLKKERGFHMTGTCLPNGKQFSQSLKATMSLEIGQGLAQQTSDAGVMAMRWKNRNDVFMLSMEHSSVQAMSPARSAYRAGKMKPTCVLMYNKYMCGVDTNDQMESNYSLCRCTRKLWKMLVIHVAGLAITNAYIYARKRTIFS